MKSWFRNLEMAVVGICGIGMTMKLLHLSFADMLLLFAFFTLASLYLLMGLVTTSSVLHKINPLEDDTDLNNFEKQLLRASGLGMSVAVIGVLFHLLHWEGSEMQLMIGSISCAVCMLVSLITLRVNQPAVFQFLFYRLMPVAFMSGALYLTAPDI